MITGGHGLHNGRKRAEADGCGKDCEAVIMKKDLVMYYVLRRCVKAHMKQIIKDTESRIDKINKNKRHSAKWLNGEQKFQCYFAKELENKLKKDPKTRELIKDFSLILLVEAKIYTRSKFKNKECDLVVLKRKKIFDNESLRKVKEYFREFGTGVYPPRYNTDLKRIQDILYESFEPLLALELKFGCGGGKYKNIEEDVKKLRRGLDQKVLRYCVIVHIDEEKKCKVSINIKKLRQKLKPRGVILHHIAIKTDAGRIARR